MSKYLEEILCCDCIVDKGTGSDNSGEQSGNNSGSASNTDNDNNTTTEIPRIAA